MAAKNPDPSEGDLKSQVDAANERYTKNPVRTAADVAMGRSSTDLTPEELAARYYKGAPPSVAAMKGAINYNTLPPEAVRASDVAVANAKANVGEMSGGLVAPTADPDVVTRNVDAMNNWRNTGLDEHGNILTPEQRIARHKAEMDLEASQKPGQLATRNVQSTLPNEPDRTLALRGERSIVPPAPPEPPITTLALRESPGPLAVIPEEAAQTALSGGGGLTKILKGPVGKTLPFIGDAIQGIGYGIEGHSVGRGIAAGVGSFLGRVAGGAAGTAVAPGVGTTVGSVVGSTGGAYGGAKLYDNYIGTPKPQPSAPVAAAPEPAAEPTDKRTDAEKYQDALQHYDSMRQAEEQNRINQYLSFKKGVAADRAMETAQGLGHSNDPVVNEQNAEALAAAAKDKAEAYGGKPEQYLPPIDQKLPDQNVIMANRILANPNMTLGERLADTMATTPRSMVGYGGYGAANEARTEKNAGLSAGAESKADRALYAAEKLENAQKISEFQQQKQAATEKSRQANRALKLAAQTQQQIRDLDKNPMAKAADPKRYQQLHQQLDYYMKMAQDGLSESGVDSGEATGNSEGNNIPQTSSIPSAAVDALLKNPKLKDQFEAKYGKGSSSQYLTNK
jgi:hypothetical protein